MLLSTAASSVGSGCGGF